MVHTLKALTDNFVFAILDPSQKEVFLVDPSVGVPVLKTCLAREWRVGAILNTHHHWDHVGGNGEIQSASQCPVIGYEGDRGRIPGMTHPVKEGEVFSVGPFRARALFIPGHTLGHIAYYFEKPGALFCGDTLFSLGCGRLFEGTAEQMFHSLRQLAALPPETKVYCGHEYTLANARFALSLDPQSSSQKENYATLEKKLLEEGATVPSTIGYELEWNPFLRCKTPWEFAELRKRKDQWNG